MPIPEPEGALWALVKPLSGWPETDEEVIRDLARGWQMGSNAHRKAGGFDPGLLTTAWATESGTAYLARVRGTLKETDDTATHMEGLVRQATRLAHMVTHAKTSIRTLMSAGAELFEGALHLSTGARLVAGPPGAIAGTAHLATFPVQLVQRLAGEVNDILARTAAIVSASPDLPLPPLDTPSPQQDGGGSGPYRSDPNTLDQELYELGYDAVAAGAHWFLPDAGEHLAHYLDGTGTTMDVNPDEVRAAVPDFNANIETQLDQQLRETVSQAVASRDYGRPIPFSSGWSAEPTNIENTDGTNWHYAVGRGYHGVTGVVTVHPPTEPDGPANVEVTYQSHIYDRYDWDASDPDKHAVAPGTDIAVLGTSDAFISQFHRAGTAMDYDTLGSSAPRTETREVRLE